MTFKIREESGITVKKGSIETPHREITDAMQDAINWLSDQSVGISVIITEKTTVTKTSS